jgi:hypothetical protein
MGGAIGQSLPFAVGLALSPFPLVAMVLILSGPRARVNGPLFARASVGGLALVGTVVLVVSGDEAAADSGAPADWVSWLRLALGLLLLWFAGRSWSRRQPVDGPARSPAWIRTIDTLTWPRALGMGALASALNPKNLALAIAGSAAIAQAELPAGESAVALAVMVAIGTLGVSVPLALHLTLGERSAGPLGAVKDAMVRYNDVIIAVIAVIFGVTLIGDAISGLTY